MQNIINIQNCTYILSHHAKNEDITNIEMIIANILAFKCIRKITL